MFMHAVRQRVTGLNSAVSNLSGYRCMSDCMASQVHINSLNLSLNFKPRFENLKPRFKNFKPRFERKNAH